MPDWIKRSERITVVSFRREFWWTDENGNVKERLYGFSFPCNEDGSLIPDEHVSSWMPNYEACLTGVVDGKPIKDMGIERYEHSYTEPGVIRCDCGAEVVLDMVMTNTCMACRDCGKDATMVWHRLTAQECDEAQQAHGFVGCLEPDNHHVYVECATDYNSSGQRLAPRSQWGWDTGESVSDILNSDWPVGVSRETWQEGGDF